MTNAGTLKFAVSPSNVDTSIESPAGTAYNDDKWHHVVATQGPSGMSLYVDGAAVASGPTVNSLSYNGYWRVGGDNLTGRSSKPTQHLLQRLGRRGRGLLPRARCRRGRSRTSPRLAALTPNQPPTAAFTGTPSGLSVAFDSTGTNDPDGTIASYDWDFGDGTRGMAALRARTTPTRRLAPTR